MKVSVQESGLGSWQFLLSGPAHHTWAITALSEVTGRMPGLWCTGASSGTSQGEVGWLIKKQEVLSQIKDFIWESKILNNLLDLEPHISPERYTFFSQQNFVKGYVIEEWTEMNMWNFYLMAYYTRNLKVWGRYKIPTLVITFLKIVKL